MFVLSLTFVARRSHKTTTHLLKLLLAAPGPQPSVFQELTTFTHVGRNLPQNTQPPWPPPKRMFNNQLLTKVFLFYCFILLLLLLPVLTSAVHIIFDQFLFMEHRFDSCVITESMSSSSPSHFNIHVCRPMSLCQSLQLTISPLTMMWQVIPQHFPAPQRCV